MSAYACDVGNRVSFLPDMTLHLVMCIINDNQKTTEKERNDILLKRYESSSNRCFTLSFSVKTSAVRAFLTCFTCPRYSFHTTHEWNTFLAFFPPPWRVLPISALRIVMHHFPDLLGKKVTRTSATNNNNMMHAEERTTPPRLISTIPT
jgi:hypothetical protein